jgi:hypothetical protein
MILCSYDVCGLRRSRAEEQNASAAQQWPVSGVDLFDFYSSMETLYAVSDMISAF